VNPIPDGQCDEHCDRPAVIRLANRRLQSKSNSSDRDSAVPTLQLSGVSFASLIQGDFRLPVKLLRFYEHRRLVWAGLALFMIIGRIALLPVLPIPDPVVQDEFSYLLAADTFAHGRLANPPLEQPDFFESPHILVQPAYISKYPPGQALFLAVGEKLIGHPFWGVVLSCALMVFLYCWAADAWLPPQWALIAGALTVIFFFVRFYWLESFWGGAVAACGGALVVGGLGHLLRGKPATARFSLAVGAVILYFTRPYEGGVLCTVALAILAYTFTRLRPEEKRVWARVVILPSIAVLLAGGLAAAWYNVSTTGRVTRLPFLVYAQQYDLAPKFLMQAETPGKRYNNVTIATTHTYELARYREIRALPLAQAFIGQAKYFVRDCLLQPFMGFAFVLLGIPWARARKRKRWLVLLFAASFAAVVPEVWIQFHYTAPFTIVSVILIVAATRALWYRLGAAQAPKQIRGLIFAASLVILFAPLLFHYISLRPRVTIRSSVVHQLETTAGNHLVFVSYLNGWDYAHEWVYNGASPDQAKLLFAHDLGSARDLELVQRYSNRIAWKLVFGPKESDVHLERIKLSAQKIDHGP
jgi:hypothetical protein